MPDMDNWEVDDGKTRRGPMPEDELLALIRAGEVPPGAQVRREGGVIWMGLRANAKMAFALERAVVSGEILRARKLAVWRRWMRRAAKVAVVLALAALTFAIVYELVRR